MKMKIGDIVYWDSFGLNEPLLILAVQRETWATVALLTNGNRLQFRLNNLRTREQMQGW